MENVSKPRKEDQQFQLPPGFRFHPTDEELIVHYLTKKVVDSCFCATAIAEVDFNKCEPWDLPGLAKMGEREWYYFCVRDRKYPTGLRTNRATDAGYWKATGKDKEIIMSNALIGMKKTLVFYKGRAPRGEKTNWVMHEYRLEGKNGEYNNLPKSGKSEWVICRVFDKSPCGKKMHISKLGRFNCCREKPSPASSLLPPLMDSSPYVSETTTTTAADLSQVTCFSHPNQTENERTQDDIVESMETPILDFSSSSRPYGITPLAKANPESTQIARQSGNSMLRENHGLRAKQNQKAEFLLGRDSDADISSVMYNSDMFPRLFGNQEYSPASAGPVDIDCLWNY